MPHSDVTAVGAARLRIGRESDSEGLNMSHKSRRRGVAAGVGFAAGSALTAGFISVAAAPIALAHGATLPDAPAPKIAPLIPVPVPPPPPPAPAPLPAPPAAPAPLPAPPAAPAAPPP